MACPACGTENRAEAKFCRHCGAALGAVCPECGTPHEPGERFCDECGAALQAEPSPREAPASERRLVSVLFADLVGFTTLSDSRDAEDVRDLLSRYFETCRRLISLYGGTVEKFIGDAVMAVWGTPTAQEDDAERAVRTALDLVAAVSALGRELDTPDLAARAGVLTGGAAVTLGAEGQGMVAGDLVNTASRVQAVAEPGTVLVSEGTRRASEAAIAYADAGAFQLRGKAEPVPLWRALRVTAARGGALKPEGLEAPFVGRERELRLVKELFHACADEDKAHLVSVVGIAGIGKSRLAWEFFKYIDGLVDTIWWHRGRCLAYGEGVAYWALAEMVRMRATIVEGEELGSARAKLQQALELHVPDAEERAWIEPRLAHLLGLEEGTPGDRDDLFAAWRLFFERMAEENPTVLVFEDMQWADASLLEFIDYLLEWSRNHALYVLGLARPELAERHPGFGAGRRNATTLSLEPLSPQAMEALLSGLVPGLTDDLRAKILERAEGVPLYAVETVRMLLDRGLLVRDGDEYHPAGAIEALDVPETLHALIAARLDGLRPEERRLLQDASVLGKTFTKHGLAALSGAPVEVLDPLLSSLVRKEVLSLQADPRSPERGQYGFLQDLLKRVAYETIARSERKVRHLGAASFLERSSGPGEHELVEVVASHYLAAYEAAREAQDATEIKAKARDMLARAGERAASLAASEEAQRYFEQAAALADGNEEQAALLERAGETAQARGAIDGAATHFERAIALLEAEGRSHPAARVSASLAQTLWDKGRIDEAVARMEEAFQILAKEERDHDLATLAAQLARLRWFMGEHDIAAERIDFALEIAESLWLPDILSEALNTKQLILGARGRDVEAVALLKHALEIALENDLAAAALRAYLNLGHTMVTYDRYEEAVQYEQDGLALARRRGNRHWEWLLLAQLSGSLCMLGRWDEALARAAEIPRPDVVPAAQKGFGWLLGSVTRISIARGRLDEAEQHLLMSAPAEESGDVQERAVYAAGKAIVLRARGRSEEALSAGEEAFRARELFPVGHPAVKEGFVEAVEAALALGDLTKAAELLKTVRDLAPGQSTPYLRAHGSRLRARLAMQRGSGDHIEPDFKAAGGLLRELGLDFYLAVTLLEHGEWLVSEGRGEDAEPLLVEAREIFERLEAPPWLVRTAQVSREKEVVPHGS